MVYFQSLFEINTQNVISYISVNNNVEKSQVMDDNGIIVFIDILQNCKPDWMPDNEKRQIGWGDKQAFNNFKCHTAVQQFVLVILLTTLI